MNLVQLGAVIVFSSASVYFVFHRYEPRNVRLVAFLVLVFPTVLSGLIHTHRATLAIAAATVVSYWLLILFFAAVYRLSPFHPLAKYPGPLLHKLTKLSNAETVRRGYSHLFYEKLHQKHGDFVRVGPNELFCANVEGVLASNNLPKSNYYSGRYADTVFTAEDNDLHAALRRPWNRAFNSTSIKDYNDLVIGRWRELIDALDKRVDETVDMSRWMVFFSFDSMGDVVFSFPFNIMKDGEDIHGYSSILTHSLRFSAIYSQISWAMSTIIAIGYTFRPNYGLQNISTNMAQNRLKSKSMLRDVFYHLSNEDGIESKDINERQLFADALVAIVAGSDTASSVLANFWYFMLQNPDCYARLQKEVDDNFPLGEEPLDQARLSSMPYLNACINETLRIQPPAPGGSHRVVPEGSGGKMFGSEFIPEGTHISVPHYLIHRDPRYFYPYPKSYWPDRWLEPSARKSFDDIKKPFGTDIEIVHDTRAFIPFSFGSRNCVGKNLAQVQLRLVVAGIAQKFNMKLADGFSHDNWRNSQKDYFILEKGPLPVTLTRRF